MPPNQSKIFLSFICQSRANLGGEKITSKGQRMLKKMHCFISVNQSRVQRSLIMILNQRNANHFIHIHKLPTTCGFWKGWGGKASWKEEGGTYSRSKCFPSTGPFRTRQPFHKQISDRLSSSHESSSKRWSESQASSWSGWPVTATTVPVSIVSMTKLERLSQTLATAQRFS